jgi:glucose-6-phosphate-specific signal transduction histidine kinase
VQEQLNNISKYAKATKVTITISNDEKKSASKLTITVLGSIPKKNVLEWGSRIFTTG